MLQQNKYNLVHAQFGQSGILAIPKRLPLVVTFRGDDLEGIVGKSGKYTWGGYVLRAVSSLVAWRADALIVVSERLKRQLPKRNAEVIPSGLDLNHFPIISQDECRNRLGLPLNKRLVLFVGNPSETVKRYQLACKVVGLLDSTLEARLVVACRVPHSDIPLYMNACDALLFTSSHEGSPNVIKEALACNLPVVSVDVGDVSERLRGVEGCTVCQDDRPETLASELTCILRARQRANGRATLLDLDEGALTRRVVAVYESVLSGVSAVQLSSSNRNPRTN